MRRPSRRARGLIALAGLAVLDYLLVSLPLLVSAVIVAASVPVAAWAWRAIAPSWFGWVSFQTQWIFFAAGGVGTSFIPPSERFFLLGSAASLVVAVAVWWWRRRKDRRKALARWGARELARLRSMVATLRDRARPRPVFKPGRVAI